MNQPLDSLILTIRKQKVILDADLAGLYGVKTKALNQAIKRNLDRFPSDFMFQLTAKEWKNLRSQPQDTSSQSIEDKQYTYNRSQSVTGSQKHRDPRYLH